MRPLSDCAVHTYSHDLARPRRTLQETQASSRQVSKKIKKNKQIQKNERKAFWTLAVTSQCRIIKGPKGPEPALGFFEKKPGLSRKNLVSHVDMSRSKQNNNKRILVLLNVVHYNNNKSFRPTSPVVARTFFSFYVIIITLTLRFRLRYVTVAGATFSFSFTLRYRSGREAHRGSR
jgi:hypothetical protein